MRKRKLPRQRRPRPLLPPRSLDLQERPFPWAPLPRLTTLARSRVNLTMGLLHPTVCDQVIHCPGRLDLLVRVSVAAC